ncbi:mycofactocin system FadH/OYE family oxidoreductase 2 [Peribacillus cavernae]|uniref:Mycofactocin system FadH/OYE family oxidoreductase 2 n=1 Tax=Peribacillus cavernae TaxID=1674310 RepID=A0A3S0V8U1_9BACI|nr:FAD-dependent oxidoreductase [Peribacillus cavernae]MDQ0219430.1 mycofactocin system FadH/OYE family oxidoreductase 2 [Peribacillus cavernae]RUQ27144.1 mycofactocin system FadH/OYE family oxidoreductase 2 [Peribacillus cavernae]
MNTIKMNITQSTGEQKNHFEHLFQPLTLGNVTIKNRIVFLPHFNALASEDGKPTERDALYFAERAKGGAGLVIMYAVACSPSGKMSDRFLHGWDPAIVPELKNYSKLVHENGAKIFGQINHGGHTTLKNPPQILYAPTQMPEPSSQFNTKEMEMEDINEVIEGFAKSALHFKQAGFDGVEIKVAHDGLLRSFVSEFFNRRTDEYGGSYENRLRLPLEVIKAIREEVGNEFPVGIRLCLDEYTTWGYNLDYGVKLARTFEETGQVTYINTDAGTFSSFQMEIPPAAVPKGFAVHMAAALKQNITLPVVAFGRISTPEQAEKILADGNADMVGMARPLIADPELPNKARQGNAADIRECISCNDGCIFQVMQEKPIRCIHNPAAGREKTLGLGTLKQAEIKKKLVVIGGGPAGLKVSEIAALRGHTVTLVEKNDRLGGQLLLASKLPYRDQLLKVPEHLIKRIHRLGVEVLVSAEATVENILARDPDAIVVATGSSSATINKPGYNQENVFTVYDVLQGNAKIGEKVMIIDGGGHFKGGGLAEYLAAQGKQVNIVTPLLHVGQNLEPSNREMLLQRLSKINVTMTPHHTVETINRNEALLKNVYSDQEINADGYDTFIYVTHNFSKQDLYVSLKGKHKEVHRVGDCVSPRMIEQAIWEGEMMGRKL